MNELTPDLEKNLTALVERMPAFPRSVQLVLDLTRNINCPPKELVGVIEKDPVMTVKILKVINSAYFSLPSKITSVNQSVVFLGINTVKNLALSIAAAGILPRANNAGFDMQRYLLHSLATAGVARQLCGSHAQGEADPGDCYVAGLLHDFGKVVFAQFIPTRFRTALEMSASGEMPLYRAEREVIGADHGVVGGLLAKRWQFAPHLIEAIRAHHAEEGESTALLDCLRVADQICRGDLTDEVARAARWQAEKPVAARFGDNLAALVAGIGEFDKIVRDGMAFVQAESVI